MGLCSPPCPFSTCFCCKGNCSCRRRALVFHWDEKCFLALRMQHSVLLCLGGRHMSLCFVFHSPLTFLHGTEPTSLFCPQGLKEKLPNTVGRDSVSGLTICSVQTGPGNDVFQVIHSEQSRV